MPDPTASSPDLLVGELRAVRTFRLGEGGRLFPLFDDTPWAADVTTARCRVSGDPGHRAPADDCTCGLYASATADDAGQYPHAAHVLALVALWGAVVVGTRGVRAEHGRVEALWLSPAVPADLVAAAAAAHPGTRVYRERAAMLAAHPPTVLLDYEPATGRGGRRRVAAAATLVALLVLGVVAGALGSGAGATVPALVMLAAVTEVVGLGLWLRRRVHREAATFPARIGPPRGHGRGRRGEVRRRGA